MSTPGPSTPDANIAAIQRRTVATLAIGQAIGAVGITIGISTASLLARDLSGSEALAGAAQTTQVLGTAVASFLLARLMGLRGRRIGLSLGYGIGALGGAMAVVAGAIGSMPLLLLGTSLLGATSAANYGSRYAAADLAHDHDRARSLSIVVWASTIGAVAGPNLSGPSGDLAGALGLPELTGPFLVGTVGIACAGIWLMIRLRPDPLLTARAIATGSSDPAPVERTGWGHGWQLIGQRPILVAAVAGMSMAHGTMVAVMVMTPLHMEHGHASLEIIGVVISVHVLGMFAFAPLVGMLSDAVGPAVVLALGGLVLAVSLVLTGWSPMGASWQITLGLLLLGVGWSLATVAASSLVAAHAPLQGRADVQGVADASMALVAAAGGGVAGLIVDLAGYDVLSFAALVLAGGVVWCARSVAVRARTQHAEPVA